VRKEKRKQSQRGNRRGKSGKDSDWKAPKYRNHNLNVKEQTT